MWFMNEGLFVWMIILHAAILFIPGLIVLSYEWIKHHDASHVARPRPVIRTTRHPKAA